MILPDVNVLVYAFRREYAEHEYYRGWLHGVLGGSEDLALIDPVLVGFVRIVTHPRIFESPAPMAEVLAFTEVLRTSQVARPVSSSPAVWAQLRGYATSDRMLRGNLVPDAFIAAVASATGARIATADAGFARFPNISWFDPLSG
jgi:toxin-antitoxin system PIN domain toxin